MDVTDLNIPGKQPDGQPDPATMRLPLIGKLRERGLPRISRRTSLMLQGGLYAIYAAGTLGGSQMLASLVLDRWSDVSRFACLDQNNQAGQTRQLCAYARFAEGHLLMATTVLLTTVALFSICLVTQRFIISRLERLPAGKDFGKVLAALPRITILYMAVVGLALSVLDLL